MDRTGNQCGQWKICWVEAGIRNAQLIEGSLQDSFARLNGTAVNGMRTERVWCSNLSYKRDTRESPLCGRQGVQMTYGRLTSSLTKFDRGANEIHENAIKWLINLDICLPLILKTSRLIPKS